MSAWDAGKMRFQAQPSRLRRFRRAICVRTSVRMTWRWSPKLGLSLSRGYRIGSHGSVTPRPRTVAAALSVPTSL